MYFLFDFMFKTFIILKVYLQLYFHIQTSTIKRRYPTLIVRIFLFKRTHIQYQNLFKFKHFAFTKRNVLRFLRHGTFHVVARGGSQFCQLSQGGGVRSFFY